MINQLPARASLFLSMTEATSMLHPSTRVDHNLCREPCCTPLPINRQTRDGIATWSNNSAVQETPELLHIRALTQRLISRIGVISPEARGGRTAGEGVERGAAIPQDGKPQRAGLGKKGTLPQVLKTYHVKLWNKMCANIFGSLVIPIVFPVQNKCC